MTEHNPRPVPRWLHVWAVLTVAATFFLLGIGQLVTSFGAGMADRVWPTEPWYVFQTATDSEKERFRVEFAFFIEHTHRIAAFAVGGLTIVLAFGLWWTNPNRRARWIGLVGLIVLIVGFGDFHRGLMAPRDVAPPAVRLPPGPMGVMLVGIVLVGGAVVWGYAAGARASGLRLLGVAALGAVMVQGLLGGFRVKLNELVGTDLAAVHGVFAQVVFGLLVSLAVMTARPSAAYGDRRSLSSWAVALAVLLFVQIVWGAMVRHAPTPLAQRLHFLTAFLAAGVALRVLIVLVCETKSAELRLGGWLLGVLLIAQVVLGVEAWMAKFGAYTLPELVPITKWSGAVRTLHALIGSGLFATALAVAVRLGRTRTRSPYTSDDSRTNWDQSPAAVTRAVTGSRFRGDRP